VKFSAIDRPRLTERIQKAAQYRVVLISASAGFGKSVALRQFLSSSGVPHVLFNVRRDQNTLLSFVRGFAEALSAMVPHLRASFPTAYESACRAREPAEALARWFHDNVQNVNGTVVIDDAHHATTVPQIANMLSMLISSAEGYQRWILSTRSTVEFPIASWWERGAMELPLDENVLRFTYDEALSLASTLRPDLSHKQVAELMEFTDGWPIALLLALRISGDLAPFYRRPLQAYTHDVVYKNLAKRAFLDLPERLRRFLLLTCMMPDMDVTTLEHFGADEFAVLLDNGIFFEETITERYRYPDLFRAFLESELDALGPQAQLEALQSSAQALERAGRYSETIPLLLDAGDAQSVVRLLTKHGPSLLEKGSSDVVQVAMASIPGDESNSTILSMRALVDAQRGRFDTSDAWFRSAIEHAPDLIAKVTLSAEFAAALCERRRVECIEILEPLLSTKGIPPALRARMYSTLGMAYVFFERFSEGRAAVDAALRFLDDVVDRELYAHVYHNAAWVALFTGDVSRAKTLAPKAVQLALEDDLFDVAARSYSILYNIAYDVEDDPQLSRDYLNALLDCGLKSGSARIRVYGLLALYDLEAEAGDFEAMTQLRTALEAHEVSFSDFGSLESFIPGQAIEAAAQGDFKKAYTLCAPTADRQATDDRKAMRLSEIALYAAGSFMESDARTALASLEVLAPALERRAKRTIRTRINAAIANALLDNLKESGDRLRELLSQIPLSDERNRLLAETASALVEHWQGKPNHEGLLGHLERLRSWHLGGIAGMLEALPRRTTTP